ncbi:permease-like cell division protein FtsX, partial [Thiococcus pfennigii]|uniref:permease-like cell division protein FtsX n=1 Tax=Thiococcus pfennigii TaxID=1057 RepID=UPI00190554FC
FLVPSVVEADAERLAARLRERRDVAEVRVIGRDEALAEFRAYSGLEDVLAGLPGNPLPVVLSIVPPPAAGDAAALEGLAAALERLPETDLVRHDADWVHRFQALVELAQRGVSILASVLGLALLLIVGNTIRLEIENRRDEIRIQELVGATNAFIRRPFVYAGLWYGLLGGLVACLLVIVGLLLIQAPVSRVASLYQADFPLIGLSLPVLAAMLGTGTLLGYLGSWLAVTWHLRASKPE